MSTFYYHTEVNFHGVLTTIHIDDFKLRFLMKRDLLFVGKFSAKISEQKIQLIMNRFSNHFCSIYSKQEIDTWDHDLKKFFTFEKKKRAKEKEKRQKKKAQRAKIMADFTDRMWNHSSSTIP